MTAEAAVALRRRLGRALRRLQSASPARTAGATQPTGSPARAAAGDLGAGSTPATTRGERLGAVLAAVRAPAPQAVARGRRPRVALIAGEGLAAALRPDAELIEPVAPGDVTAGEAELVVVEVRGGAVAGGWDDAALDRLVEAVGDLPPVLVWVTDPHPVADAATATARLTRAARAVSVVDERGAGSWRAAFPGVDVDVLPLGVQPRHHPPAEHGGRVAGAALVLDAPISAEAVLPSAKATAVLDVWPLSSGAVPVPPALKGRLAPAVTAAEAGAVPGRYSVLLDTVREPGSPVTSVLGAAAAQTAVVTTPGLLATLPEQLRPHVAVADTPPEIGGELLARVNQGELRDREGLRLHRAVLGAHTTAHRLAAVQHRLGLDVVAPDRSVSAVVPTNRDHELDNVLANLGRQVHQPVQLVLVLHGLDVDEASLRGRARDAGVGELVVVRADASLTLGACMNLGVEAADGRFVAKMDDDNHYGAHYLTDLVAAFDYTDASIVGKWAHYVWLRSSGAVVLRQPAAEHTYERRVQGGSMLFDADLLREVPFSDIPRAVDSDILDRSIAHGARVYSADRFNYVSVRGADRLAHTWTVADHTFMTATGQLQFYGDPREHVDV
jgi:hypothetical protein